ncbi:hypothetical protein TrLO_g11770 [Triparma laevis f. longispina]|uniref:Endonuclease/exonuclease/phosphatase domain-containing protein n=1 Tax=Triparma laevis f. longispina TaxID=1714387 RepID=A0A9W7EGD5_9STRA|nr:hypothetical protein TrLO_g11770 [Triparma laevis f. longispina]
MISSEKGGGLEGIDDKMGAVKEESSNLSPKPSPGKVSTSSPLEKTPQKPKTHNYVIMQWNQKDLTLLPETVNGIPNPKYGASKERVENVAKTIKEYKNKKGPAVCVFEEVRTGGGGERAVKFIVNWINIRLGRTTWDYCLSGEVNPEGRRRELYAVIWCKDIMGEIWPDLTDYGGRRLMGNGFCKPTTATQMPTTRHQAAASATEDEAPSFRIGDALIDLTDVRKKWQQLDAGGDVNLYFDRLPVLFTFKPPEIEFKIHIIACHSATGGESKSPHQNIIETAYLQSMCTQATEQGEFVVLLGDFNTAERHNQTEYMWDRDVPFLSEEESELFRPTRAAFLECYYRGVPSALPTNVYPFLSGECATPKHNDDIWLPTNFDKMNRITNRGRLDSRGNRHQGVVLPIPERVLGIWDKKTREYFLEIGNNNFRSAKKQELNRRLSMAWSDHRPISVDLSPSSRSQSTGRSSRKSTGSTVVFHGEALDKKLEKMSMGDDDTRNSQSQSNSQEQGNLQEQDISKEQCNTQEQDISKEQGSLQEQDISKKQGGSKKDELTILLLSAQDKLRQDPKNPDIQAEVDHYTRDLEKLEQEEGRY